MGIRHLTAFLRSFAPVKPICGPLVVDGSALAYHLYYICLGKRADASNSFEALPTYGELQEGVVGWLSDIRKKDVVIGRIFFDGYLPLSKVPTRLERLIVSSTQLIEYHARHREPYRASAPKMDEPISLFENMQCHPGITSLKPLPFLVPAVLDAVLRSEFKNITTVVPEEADVVCADYVKRNGGTILTGDSDLLLHDIGESGGVIFIPGQRWEEHAGQLYGQVFYPTSIATQLGLPETYQLRSLAFEMTKNKLGKLKFGQLVQRAQRLKAIEEDPSGYAEFLKEYLGIEAPADTSSEQDASQFVHSVYEILDPRVSEYVLQFPSQAKLAGRARALEAASNEPFHMFLPPLLDCPNRTTGWEVSSVTRQLAYGLMSLVVPVDETKTSVFEHRKQQANSSGRELLLPTAEEMRKACQHLAETLEKIAARLPQLTESQRWMAIAVCQNIEWAHSNEKPALSVIAAKKLANLKDVKESRRAFDWDLIHFFAEIQASLYSLRILQQITRIVMPRMQNIDQVQRFSLPLFESADLPAFTEYPDPNNVRFLMSELQSTIDVSYAILGIEQDRTTAGVVAKPLKKENKRVRKEAQVVVEDPKRQKSNNPFDVLSPD